MRITSAKMPSVPFEIMKNGSDDVAVFYDAVEESGEIDGITGQQITIWNYDRYMLPVTNGPNLYASIESNFAAWLQKAKDYEADQEAAKIRAYRDKLLNDCDTVYCNAANWALKDDAGKALWQTYKQNLRDIPQQSGFPYSVTFPALPEAKAEE